MQAKQFETDRQTAHELYYIPPSPTVNLVGVGAYRRMHLDVLLRALDDDDDNDK